MSHYACVVDTCTYPNNTKTVFTTESVAGGELGAPFSIYRCRDMGLRMLLLLHVIIP